MTGPHDELILCPMPQRMEFTGGTHRGPIEPELRIDDKPVVHEQGYNVAIEDQKVIITAHAEVGFFYGRMTLQQLLHQANRSGELPCLYIEDWPDYSQRGVMLDISRDKVPTMDTLFDLVELLASWKINQLQLYTEHTFAYRNHRSVWEHASPITEKQVRELDAYCRERFIELVPNQNSFGHMHRWLERPQYRHLAEAPDGYVHPAGHRSDRPFSLCPVEPRSVKLLAELYDELLPNFSSRLFNVGCDETWDLGQGRSKQACEQRGAGRVYLDFLLEIHKLVTQRDRTMMFWGDIILQYPDLVAELPKDTVALSWGYEADHPFDAEGEQFAAAGVPFYVCPGTSSWNSLAGRTDNAIANMRNAAENGRRHGAIGYLNTDWGDNGHWQALSASYLGYACGAAMSWAIHMNRDPDLPRVLDLFAFRDDTGVLGQAAYDLGNVYRRIRPSIQNGSVPANLLIYPERPISHPAFAGMNVANLNDTLDDIRQIIARLSGVPMQHHEADLSKLEFIQAANLLEHACLQGIARLENSVENITDLPRQVRVELAASLEPLIAEHRRLWLKRNRMGGLSDSTARMKKVLELYSG